MSAPSWTRTSDSLLKRQLLCQLSYRGSGDHGTTPSAELRKLPANFAGKYTATADGCWTWTAATQTHGYGSFCVGQGRTALAHRLAWETWHGPIPDGLTVDHLCRNVCCVHPCHMELVTTAVNTEHGVTHYLATTPTYPCGHPRLPENTYTPLQAESRWLRRCARRAVLPIGAGRVVSSAI